MTSHEILKADLLDILFENRNKQYGAYSLRRNYPKELAKALGIALSSLLLLYFLFQFQSEKKPDVWRDGPPEIKVSTIEIPKIEIPKPPVQARPPAVPKTAAANFTTIIKVVEQPDPKHQMQEQKNILTSALGTVNEDGPEAGAVQVVPKAPEGAGGGQGKTELPETRESEFVPVERMPEFPGGKDAWVKFLNRHLRTPDELLPGEKKVVHVSFQVDQQGYITNFKVAQSGGRAFDEEVIRVLRKMPRWIPALQNGQAIPVSFTQPVTFVGLE